MIKKLYNSVITVLVLLSVFCVFVSLCDLVSAHSVALITPPSNGIISGAAFNISAQVSYASSLGSNISNCTFTYSVDSGTTWVTIGSDTNGSSGELYFENVTDTTSWTETEDMWINVSCYTDVAGTALNCSSTNTGMDIDNSAPTVSEMTIINPKQIYYVTSPVEIKCIGGDPGNHITVATITKPSGKTVEKRVTSADGWKVVFKNADTNEAGLYYVDCMSKTSYGTNSTSSSLKLSFRVIYDDVETSDGGEEVKAVAKTDISTKDTNTGLIVGKQGETKTFTMDGATAHEIEFMEVTFTSATLEIRSDPVTITLDVGQYKNVDVDGDGTDDIKVTLSEIENDAAKVEVINLEKYAEKQEEERGVEEEVVEEAASSSAGLWITILVILVVIGVGYYLLKGKKGKKGQVKFSKQDLCL